jgi:predicted nucleic acid-binding Zn ribbon protein
MASHSDDVAGTPVRRCWHCGHAIAVGLDTCPECGVGAVRSAELRELDRWRSSRARTFVTLATAIVAVLVMARHGEEWLSPYAWQTVAMIEPLIGLGSMSAVVLVAMAMRTSYARWQWIVAIVVVAGIVYVHRFWFGF